MPDEYTSRLLPPVGFVQGGYYILTGLWSLVSIETFQLVTGPKTDIWLVKTVGLLVIVSGLVFIRSAVRRSFPPETVLLAVGNALALAVIEFIYTGIGRISGIYLADAILELIFAGTWLAAIHRQNRLRNGESEY
jgi:hypothetical protein